MAMVHLLFKTKQLADQSEVVVMSAINFYRSLFVSPPNKLLVQYNETKAPGFVSFFINFFQLIIFSYHDYHNHYHIYKVNETLLSTLSHLTNTNTNQGRNTSNTNTIHPLSKHKKYQGKNTNTNTNTSFTFERARVPSCNPPPNTNTK